MPNPAVSVLLTVYNGQDYLEEAIESILGQTFQDIELIVIDDGSVDSSWQIIQRLAGLDPRIVADRCDQNIGTSLALNKGLAAARGEFITRQDSDDISLSNRLAEQVGFLKAHPETGAVGTNVIYVDPEGRNLGESAFVLDNTTIQWTLLDTMCFCGPTLLARRACFAEIGLHFEDQLSYAEDYDLCLRLAEVTKLANIETPLYKYRQHSSSVSRTKQSRQLRNKAIAMENALKRRSVRPSSAPSVLLGEASNMIRDYLRASIIACQDDQWEDAIFCLERAQKYDPNILKKKKAEDIITGLIFHKPFAEALCDTTKIFDELLPKNAHLSWLKSRVISKIYFREVFEESKNMHTDVSDSHLWNGLRHNPFWLFNRGVSAMVFSKLIKSHSSNPIKEVRKDRD